MGATDRVVRHLTLLAASEASVRHGLLMVQDAMRCASLPHAGERVLLVRRLHLGRFSPNATAQSLSRLLEQKVAAAGGTWIHALQPSAEHADYVFFRDVLEARCELALHLAQAMPCVAWYWPLAVPEFKAAESPQSNLRRIALSLAALPEARVALPAWIAHVTAARIAPIVVRALETTDLPVLLAAAQVAADASRRTAGLPAKEARFAKGADFAGAPRALGARDASAHGKRATTAATAEAALPAWWLMLAHAGGFVADTRRMQAAAASVDTASSASSAAAAAASDQRGPFVGGSPSAVSPASAAPGSEQAIALAYGHPALQSARTGFGGLLFLLPVLQRLDFAAWAETLPQDTAGEIARRMLGLVLRRLHAAADDPAWMLTRGKWDEAPDVIEAQAPAGWHASTLMAPCGRPAADLVTTAQHPLSATALAALWLTACRRWLRRQARIGIASLVSRPAAFDLNATHADVYFRLGDTDMRVRRAALDINPGWVWWFGRVVHFHYDETWPGLPDLSSHGTDLGS